MEKILTALSNEVFRHDNKIIKKYIMDDFKKHFGNQEDKGLIAHGINFDLLQNGYEIEYIEHQPWINETATMDDNIRFVKWLKKMHDEIDINTLDVPGFAEAYYNVLNLPQGKFMKKLQFMPHEQGMVNDALHLLTQGKQVFLHNDLVEGNILKIGNDFKLIDFEYCGVGNSLFDLGSFLTERKLSMEEKIRLAKTYDENINLDDLWIISSFLQAFWSRWAAFKFHLTQMPIYREVAQWKQKEFINLVK